MSEKHYYKIPIEKYVEDELKELEKIGIDVIRLPIKNVETDLIAITKEGIDNIDAIIKWERLRRKLEGVL